MEARDWTRWCPSVCSFHPTPTLTHTHTHTHTRACACTRFHTHTPALGRGLVVDHSRQEKLFFSPHSHRFHPKKGSTASWFMLRWERLAQEQWHFRKTPLCSGETRRGFPSGPRWSHCPCLPTTTATWRSLGPAFHLSYLLTHSPDWLNPSEPTLPGQQQHLMARGGPLRSQDKLTKGLHWGNQ